MQQAHALAPQRGSRTGGEAHSAISGNDATAMSAEPCKVEDVPMSAKKTGAAKTQGSKPRSPAQGREPRQPRDNNQTSTPDKWWQIFDEPRLCRIAVIVLALSAMSIVGGVHVNITNNAPVTVPVYQLQ